MFLKPSLLFFSVRQKSTSNCVLVLFLLLGFFCQTAAFAQVRRIVSLAPSATEWVDAFGLSSQLVGVTEQCDYPVTVGKISKVGSFMRTSVEQVLIKNPTDVVAVDGLPASLSQKFISRGIRVHIFSVQRLEDFPREIRKLGEALGAKPQADSWAERFDQLVKTKAESARVGESVGHRRSFLLLVSFQPPFVGTHYSWLSDLFERSGVVNATRQVQQVDARSGQFLRLSREAVLGLQVDEWIGFADSPKESERVRDQLAQWNVRPSANKNRVVRVFPADVFTRPGPRLLLAARQLQDALQ